MAEEKLIGKIVHYYTNIGVGIIELVEALRAGEKVHVKGSSTDFEQVVDSMQVEHQNVEAAKAGESIGVKLAEKAKENDQVFKVLE